MSFSNGVFSSSMNIKLPGAFCEKHATKINCRRFSLNQALPGSCHASCINNKNRFEKKHIKFLKSIAINLLRVYYLHYQVITKYEPQKMFTHPLCCRCSPSEPAGFFWSSESYNFLWVSPYNLRPWKFGMLHLCRKINGQRPDEGKEYVHQKSPDRRDIQTKIETCIVWGMKFGLLQIWICNECRFQLQGGVLPIAPCFGV